MEDTEEDTINLPEGQRAVWKSEDREVVLLNEEEEVANLNPYTFEKLANWVQEKNIERHYLYFRRENQDHILVDGDTLCNHNVRVPQDAESDDLKPFPETTEREWRVILATKNLCSSCRSSAARAGLLPEVPKEMPAFPCPECGEKTTNVTAYMGIGMAKHDDGTTHEFDFDVFEKWRRGGNPEEIESRPSRKAFD